MLPSVDPTNSSPSSEESTPGTGDSGYSSGTTKISTVGSVVGYSVG